MEMDVEEVTVGGGAQEDAVFLRLSPSVLSALSMRLVNSTLKAALGNTAVAISKQKSLTETIMTSYCLDGISRNFSGAAAADSPALQQNSSHLIAKAFAASFVERCCLLAPKGKSEPEEDEADTGATSSSREEEGEDEEGGGLCDALVVEVVTQSLCSFEKPPPSASSSASSSAAAAVPSASASAVHLTTQASSISWAPWI
jgi:hypothetical protein